MQSLLLLLTLAAQERPQVTVQNPAAEAVFDLNGGSFVSFKFKNGLNPLRWLGPADTKATYRPMAHFLCLDRWGQPSDAEVANGMPYHGEATRVAWKINSPGIMSASLPMAGLDVTRRVLLDPQAALVTVQETVVNRNKLGKLYNMVQHPTIGPPFLDEDTVVDANARRGFAQSSPLPNPEEPSFYWPQAFKDEHTVNLRFLRQDPLPNVVSYVVDEALGWATASSAKQGLLIGYLWKTSEYPWFNAWRHVDENRKPLARGLEFGTTGLHQPFPVLVRKSRIFGRLLYAYLDAGESTTRSYAAFLLAIPPDWQGVGTVTVSQGKVIVTERGSQRKLEVAAAPAW
ncbi:MAG: hypothetical protein K2X03_07310 [Bryobacteraceae bacterium]|nr:hypothetical protein [Bryobacteraceae bacterium]